VILRLLLPLFACTCLVACSSSQTPGQQAGDPLGRSSAVSVAMPGFVTDENTVLNWRSDLIWVDDPEGRFERRGQILQQALQQEFERKGYRFATAQDSPDYDVVAVVLLGELQDHAEIQEIFRLYPSLANPAAGYGKGTVMLAIAPHGTSDIVWRGALEVYTDPGMQPVNARDERLKWIAQQLLGSIPAV
jgi:hypothetical protein